MPCRITGRLIRKVVQSGGSPGIPRAEISQRSAQRSGNGNSRQTARPTPAVEAVRILAQKMAGGTHSLQDMHQVPADVVQWLSGLDRVQLCRLVCAKPEDLAAYMSGRTHIRGMPPYLELTERPAPRRTADREMGYNPALAPAM